MLVNSVPLSLTIISGLPRRPMMVLSSRATLAPEIDVSAISPKHSLLKSDHTQDAEAPATDEAVRDEVQRPALVRPLRDRHRRTRAQRPLAATTAAHPQAFLAVDAKQLLVVGRHAFAGQKIAQTPITEPAALSGQFA